MLKYVTSEEYKSILNVTDIPENFDDLVIEASAYINKATQYRIDEPSGAVQYVTCKLIDLLVKEHLETGEVSNVKSENVDGWSKTYSTVQEVEAKYEQNKISLLTLYLSNEVGKDGNPLMFRGVNVWG